MGFFLLRSGRRVLLTLFIAFFAILPVMLTACGGNSGNTTTGSGTPASTVLACDTVVPASTPVPNNAAPTTTAPNDLITSGTLTVGSDTTYPPQEFIDTATGKPTGFDVDLITAIAQKLGLKGKVVTANFSTIIDDLSVKRYDVVISALTINPERLKKADFVPYFSAGESLLVANGNPKNIKCANNLCGLRAGVQDGTVELDDLNAASKKCTAAGKAPIQLTVLKDQTAVIQLLANGRVDGTYQDSPVTDYYIKQNNGRFTIGGSVVNAAVEGIAIRKGNSAMLNAIQGAFNALKSDGTYDQLFTKWQLNAAQKVAG